MNNIGHAFDIKKPRIIIITTTTYIEIDHWTTGPVHRGGDQCQYEQKMVKIQIGSVEII